MSMNARPTRRWGASASMSGLVNCSVMRLHRCRCHPARNANKTTNMSAMAPVPCFWPMTLTVENATYRCVSSATLADYADFMDWFVSTHYAATTKVQVVQDNLNTHTSGAFYEHLPAERAHQLKNTLEFHFTPKYGSWLNRAEIELSVLVRQCLDRPIASREELEREVFAWQNERNDTTMKIAWTSTTPKARLKFQRHYKKLNSKN
jgi:hypothetical protein